MLRYPETPLRPDNLQTGAQYLQDIRNRGITELIDCYTKVQNLSLIIQPGDSFFPIVAAIDSATTNINMTIFRMDDPVVRDAMIRAVGRGVKVNALIAPQSKGWGKRNRRLAEDLTAIGVETRTPRTAKQRIKIFHYKTMTIDDAQALIFTFNPTQKNLHYARDFGVAIRDSVIVAELNRLFEADWEGSSFKPRDLPLVISPYNSRTKLAQLLSSAQRTIRIMDAKLKDPELIGVLLMKAADGCDVRVLSGSDYYHEVTANFHIRKLVRYKLHAKCVSIDGQRFFVGSMNLRRVSLDQRRDVGITIADDAMARKIERVFDEDWSDAVELREIPDARAI
jgi:phosphatidylserine/phosphatidylglycerophosphate/cardiolipin synthase-like enzyme